MSFNKPARRAHAAPAAPAVGINALIYTLMQKSARVEKQARCSFITQGSRYSIDFLQSSARDSDLIYKILTAEFSREEMDPFSDFNACWCGIYSRASNETLQYRVCVARNGMGKIVSVYVYGLILLDPERNPRDRLMIGFYAVTLPEYRGHGLNRELYLSALLEESWSARQANMRVAAVAGDATERSERAWNSAGRSRAYYCTEADSKEYTEVVLLMPWIGFNTGTDLLTKDDFAPEHLMLQGLAVPESGELVAKIMAAFYRWSEEQGMRNIRTPESLVAYKKGMKKFLNKSLDPLKDAKSFLFLKAHEREELEAQGYTFKS